MWRNTEPPFQVDSDLGVIEHSRPRPHLGEVGELMLIPNESVDNLLTNGANMLDAPSTASASVDGDQTLFHLDWNGQRWTWELQDAHWTDIEGGYVPLMIGKLVA
jgi:hypothetical protein